LDEKYWRLDEKMDIEEQLLRRIPFVITDDEYMSLPEAMRGEIKGDYNLRRMPGRFLGHKTIRLSKKTLIEGIDFEIEYSLI
jgi:hypothetical protein